jgi:hypothetical protein
MLIIKFMILSQGSANASASSKGDETKVLTHTDKGIIVQCQFKDSRFQGTISIGGSQDIIFDQHKCLCYPKPSKQDCVIVSYSIMEDGKLVAVEVKRDLEREKLRKILHSIDELTYGEVCLHESDFDIDSARRVEIELTKMREKEASQRKADIKKHLRRLRKASKAQVLFLVDCTGSMDTYINMVKESIVNISANIKKRVGEDTEVQFSFVGYRDYEDEYVEPLNFVSDTKEFYFFVDTIGAIGGGDQCEDVLSGLETAAQMKWNIEDFNTQLIYHIADSPCHGRVFAKGHSFVDDHPEFDSIDSGGMTKKALKHIISDFNVRYHFLKINDSTNNMIATFNELLLAERLPSIVTYTLTDATSMVGIITETASSAITFKVQEASSGLLSLMNSSIKFSYSAKRLTESSKRTHISPSLANKTTAMRGSVFSNMHSIEEEGEGKDHVADFDSDIVGAPLRHSKLNINSAVEVSTFSLRPIRDFTQIMRGHRLLSGKPKKMIIGSKLFSGGLRDVYDAKDVTCLNKGDEKDLVPRQYLLKLYKEYRSYDEELLIVKQDLQAQAVCVFLAAKFSELAETSDYTIRYLQTRGVEFTDSEGRKRFGSLEAVLPGEFIKWCNNTNFTLSSSDKNFSSHVAAFSHWTYEATNRYLAVVDTQGVKHDERTFLLTDPAIHSSQISRFGQTNFGKEGIDLFFKKHVCNITCRELKLPKHPLHPKDNCKEAPTP